MKKNIIIFGSEAHAIVTFFELIKFKKYNFLGFVDDSKKKGKKIITFQKKSYFNLGKANEVLIKINKNKIPLSGIVGVGLNYIRKKIVDNILKIDKNFKWESIISKNCILNGNVSIGNGTLVMSGSVINSQTIIGDHCIINTSSSIDHHNNFMNFSSCGPGVITGGNVTVGYSSYLGIGTVIKNGIKIGNNTVLGGNSFANKECVDNFLYYGVPIKKIKKRKIDDNYF